MQTVDFLGNEGEKKFYDNAEELMKAINEELAKPHIAYVKVSREKIIGVLDAEGQKKQRKKEYRNKYK